MSLQTLPLIAIHLQDRQITFTVKTKLAIDIVYYLNKLISAGFVVKDKIRAPEDVRQ